MSIFEIFAVLISFTAVFSFLNHRYLGLPTTIGVMLIALVFSLALIGLHELGFRIDEQVAAVLERIDFNKTLLQGMLSYLLFAGALHVNLDDLAKQKWVIATLATFGVVTSTFLVAFLTSQALSLLDIELPFIYCLLFGALISPTDPIAVLAILRKAGASKSLETKITGESLFNDGIGVVIFVLLLSIASGEAEISTSHIAILFAEEVIGGVVYGLVLGGLGYWLLNQIDDYHVEILLTLALVTGGYALAARLHVSGPIAVVVAGLMIGNHGRLLAMSDHTREHVDTFWELIDEILNAVLFLLIGLEILVVRLGTSELLAGLLAIVIVMTARAIAVGVPITMLGWLQDFSPKAIRILTWGGLRGGISVALALSLPAGAERELVLTMTYCVVVFSILVQGMTIGRLVRSVSAPAGGD